MREVFTGLSVVVAIEVVGVSSGVVGLEKGLCVLLVRELAPDTLDGAPRLRRRCTEASLIFPGHSEADSAGNHEGGSEYDPYHL